MLGAPSAMTHSSQASIQAIAYSRAKQGPCRFRVSGLTCLVATWPLGASAAGSLAPSSLVRGMVKPSRSCASRAKWQARQGERQQAHSRSSALEPCRQMDQGV